VEKLTFEIVDTPVVKKQSEFPYEDLLKQLPLLPEGKSLAMAKESCNHTHLYKLNKMAITMHGKKVRSMTRDGKVLMRLVAIKEDVK
jgi:hypothetical protein